jgi:hypothetical protein
MSSFKSKFSYILEADDEQPKPTTDKEAMSQQLDTAKPEDFDVKPAVTAGAAERAARVDHAKIEQANELNSWIQHIDQFIDFLNGTSESSIQSKLHSASCDTMFEDIARSEKKKIARLAAELSSLSESFKGYLISSNDR